MEAKVKERPILFSAPMVRAILAGIKTQTRRIVKPQPERMPVECHYSRTGWAQEGIPNEHGVKGCNCYAAVGFPGYWPGTRIWVRETWAYYGGDEYLYQREPEAVSYRATYEGERVPGGKWRPSIFMPRWASRITLEIAEVRVQRLNDISDEDAKAEGVEPGCLTCGENCLYSGGCGCTRPAYRDSFINLWNTINGPESWDANPFVWAITFKKVEANNERA